MDFFESSKHVEGNVEDETALVHQDLELAADTSTPLETPKSSSVPFVLSFSNLTYNVKYNRKNNPGEEGTTAANKANKCSNTKVLLNDISGEAREGEILAILGASGSGKTTLIDALANRIAKGSLKGSVTLNGEVLESQVLKMISAYVMQDDLLFPMLTVEETLMFSADIRLPRSLSKSKKKARVQALMGHLGLQDVANTVIGDEGHRGVSGGERRRVSIGVDIVQDPIILLLDEPTSGLDSTSAFMVVEVLKRIAMSGSIVIMTVHQPSYRILGLLDRLIFLSIGQAVYNGSPTRLPTFFAEFGRPIPENENRAEFTLDLIRELEKSSSTAGGGTKSLVEFNKKWQINNPDNHYDRLGSLSSLKDAIRASVSRGKLVCGATNDVNVIDSKSTTTISAFANPFWIETIVLAKRTMTNSRRLPELFTVRLGAVLITGFILASMFWQLDDSPRGVEERLGFFAFALSTTFYTCTEALPVFFQERYIFMRETAHNSYRRSSYVLSHSIVAIPPLIIYSIVFSAITFWAVGLAGGLSGFFFNFCLILASFWAGSSFVTFLSGVISNLMMAYTVAVAVLAYFLLFCGFIINADRIPPYWIWFHYISLVKYPYEGVLLNEFDRHPSSSTTSKCYGRGVQLFDDTFLATIPIDMKAKLLNMLGNTVGMNITLDTCITTGVDVLRERGVTHLSKWSCLWITVAWGFLFRILFYFCLLLGSKNKRR